jgi:hypothetical protein
MTAWHESPKNLADLAHYMAHVIGSDAKEIAYAIEKPHKHDDVWQEVQMWKAIDFDGAA